MVLSNESINKSETGAPLVLSGSFNNTIENLGSGRYVFHWKDCKAHQPKSPNSLSCDQLATIEPVNTVKIRPVPLLPKKTIGLPLKKLPFCNETYKNRPKFEAVFDQPTNSGDVKLLTIDKNLDREFLTKNCLETGYTKVATTFKCWNCRQCQCEMLTLSGQSQQSLLELELVRASLHFLQPPEWEKPHFAADFLYDEKLLKQLACNREQGLLQMISLEKRLKSLAQNKKFSNLLNVWNEKFKKLFDTKLVLHEDDKRLEPYKNVSSHFIRWSYFANSASISSPVRPVSDLSSIALPSKSGTDPEPKLSTIDKSFIPLEAKKNDPPANTPVSFNNCLLKSLTTSCSVQRTWKYFRTYDIVNLNDIRSFFWHVAIKLRSAKKMGMFSRYPGNFGEDQWPWRCFYCANTLFGAGQSPPITETVLFSAVQGQIPEVSGCKHQETIDQILQNTYIDNLLLGKVYMPIYDVNNKERLQSHLTIFQLFSDMRDTLAQGSLLLQENVLPFYGNLEASLTDPQLQEIMNQTENYVKSLQDPSINQSRVPGGWSEYIILAARNSGRINILEYLHYDQHDAFDFLHQQIKQNSVLNFWEQPEIKINSLHPFPEKLKSINKNKKELAWTQFESKLPKSSKKGVKSSKKNVLSKSHKLNTVAVTPPATPIEERTKILKGFGAPVDPKLINPVPDCYSQKFSAHLYQRLAKGRELMSPLQPFDVTGESLKFLSMQYHPDRDTISYKLHLNLSTTRRGLTEGSPLGIDDLAKILSAKALSKKKILSIICRLCYDLTGYLSPFILELRYIYRTLLIDNPNMPWSQVVDNKYNKMLIGPITQIYLASQIEFPRNSVPPLSKFSKNSYVRPVCFTDASEVGGGFLLYLRHSFYSAVKNRMVHIAILNRSNSKVHSIHYTSLPRAELSSLLFSVEEVTTYLHEIKTQYLNLLPTIYLSDSLSTLVKLLPTSAVFQPYSANRLQRVKDLVGDGIYSQIGFIRGGARKFQMNLADSVTKLHFKIYSLVSQNYFFGGFLSLPQEKWPVTYLKDLKLGTFRQFDDLLSRYSTYMDRFTGPKLIHQQEDKIKKELINHLKFVQPLAPRKCKNDTFPTNFCTEYHCINFVRDENDVSHSEILNETCQHSLPIHWVLDQTASIRVHQCLVDPRDRKVSFHSTVYLQQYDQTDPVITIERFFPMAKRIHEKKLRFGPSIEYQQKLLLFTKCRDNEMKKLFYTKCNPKYGVFKTKISKKIKQKTAKISIPKTKLTKKGNKMCIKPSGLIHRFKRTKFRPSPHNFDKLFKKFNDVVTVISILTVALKWKPNYRKISSLFLYPKVEKSIIQSYFDDMTLYLTNSQRSANTVVCKDNIYFEKLRGVQKSHDFCYRILLCGQFEYSKLICRTVHNFNHYASNGTQVTVIKSLGYSLEGPAVTQYLTEIRNELCMKCLKLRQQVQINDMGSLPRCILQFERPFNVTSADCSFHYYYQNNKLKRLVILQHFLCLQTQALYSVPQANCSSQSFFNSLLQLASWTSSYPSLILTDQGSDFVSSAQQMLNLDELNVTRGSTKRQSYRDLLVGWTDRERKNLIQLGAKNGCVIAVHPSGTSHLTPAEQAIKQFRLAWSNSDFDSLNLNLFQFLTAVKSCTYIVNSRPLILCQDETTDYQITPYNLLFGNFPGQNAIKTIVPLTPDGCLSRADIIGNQALQGYAQYHSTRFERILSNYKYQIYRETPVLKRPLAGGDICWYQSKNHKRGRLCQIVSAKEPGIEGFNQSSEYQITFIPKSYKRIREEISLPWQRGISRAHVSQLTPLLPKERAYVDLRKFDDNNLLSNQSINEINKTILDLKTDQSIPLISRLLANPTHAMPLSRRLIQESLPDHLKDSSYRDQKQLRSGLAKPESLKLFPHKSSHPLTKSLPPGLISQPYLDTKTEISADSKTKLNKEECVELKNKKHKNVSTPPSEFIKQSQDVSKIIKSVANVPTKSLGARPKEVLAPPENTLRRSSRKKAPVLYPK